MQYLLTQEELDNRDKALKEKLSEVKMQLLRDVTKSVMNFLQHPLTDYDVRAYGPLGSPKVINFKKEFNEALDRAKLTP